MDFEEFDAFQESSGSETEGESRALLIHQAASTGDTRQLVLAVQQDPSLLEQPNTEGLTPLGQAVLSQQMPAVKRLVKMGANINAQDGIGRTCLSIAAYQGWLEGVVYLLRNGARQNVCDKAGRYPIHAATYDKDVRTLLTLLQTLSLAEINQQDHEQMTALHWAAFHSRPDHLGCLVERGVNVLVHDIDGKLPIHWAAQNGSVDCCRQLMQKEDDTVRKMLEAEDYTGKTAVHFAAAAGHSDIVHLLASHPACRLDSQDPDDRTPLHWASAMGHAQCVHALLDLGVRPDVVDADGGTPLSYAAQSGHSECRRMIEEALNIPRCKSEAKSTEGNSSRRGKNPLGFLKGLFQSNRKDGNTLEVINTDAVDSKPTSKDLRRNKSNKSSIAQANSPQGGLSGGVDATSEKLSLPPISRRESSNKDVVSRGGTGSTCSSLPSKADRQYSANNSGIFKEKDPVHSGRRVESRGSKQYSGTSTPSTVLPPLLPTVPDEPTHNVQLGPIRGIKVQHTRQLNGRVAGRIHDGMLIQKSATDFWSPPSRQPAASSLPSPGQSGAEPQQTGLKGKKRTRKKPRRFKGAPTSATMLSPRQSDYEYDTSDERETGIPIIPEASSVQRYRRQQAVSGRHRSSQHPLLLTGKSSSSLYGPPPSHAADTSSVLSYPSVVPEESVVTNASAMDADQSALFVAASSVSIHIRKPSVGSRDKRPLNHRKSEMRLLDV